MFPFYPIKLNVVRPLFIKSFQKIFYLGKIPGVSVKIE